MRATAIAAIGLTVALGSPGATAQPSPAAPPQILLEVRSRDGDADLLRLREELRARQVVVDPRAIAELPNEILPLTGMWDEELSLAALTAQLDAGVRAYLRGQFKQAAAQLEAGLALARRNPALVVRDATSPRWLTQALATLALTKQRLLDRAGARDAMAEQVRSFPELPVTLADYGSRGEALYLEVRGALEEGPRGSLLVDVTEPDARIYVNERGRGRGGAYAADVLPGPYRVLVVVGAESRLYRLAVHANEQTRLLIDWSEDERYRLSPRWAGLEERTPRSAPRGSSGRGDESARLRERLGRRLAFSDVIVIGAAEERGRRWVWGEVYERGSGRRLRRGEMRRAPAGDDEPMRFAEFLRSGKDSRRFRAPRPSPATGVEGAPAGAARAAGDASAPPASDRAARGGDVPKRAAPPRVAEQMATSPRRVDRDREGTERANLAGAIAFAGIGLVGLGGGAYYALESTRRTCSPCGEGRSPTWAIAMVGGGILSLGVATFFVREHNRAARGKGRRPAPVAASESALQRGAAFAIGLAPREALAAVSWHF